MTTATAIEYPRVDATALFGKKSNVKVGGVTIFLHNKNTQRHEGMGPVKGLVFHWQASSHEAAYNTYNGVVARNDATETPVVLKCLNWDEKPQHAWYRNSSYWGLTFAAMVEAVWGLDRKVNYHGPEPITPDMLECMAIYAAEVCAWKRIDPRGKHAAPEYKRVGNALVPTGRHIMLPNLLDHHDLALADGYAADRGDIGPYKPKLFNRICEVYDELKGNKRQFQFVELLK